MSSKFTLLLLGPAGSGKSAFVSSLSKIDIFDFITAKKAGGANTTKISVTYEFHNGCTDIKIIDCSANKPEDSEELLNELIKDSEDKDGIKKIFAKINDEIFAKKCIALTIQLPCKETLLPHDSIFDTIVVRDSRGFGDIDIDDGTLKTSDLGITDDVNAILFFSISSIQQPAIFSKIIENVMKVNLKTPMLLLRRDADLIQNDIDFKNSIINNIKESDPELSDIILNIEKNTKKTGALLDDLIVNLPEVKQWKGAISVSPGTPEVEIAKYSLAVEEAVSYVIKIYCDLYGLLVKKMQGEYQDKFVDTVLQQLKSEKALNIVTSIIKSPCVTPAKTYKIFRDTQALSKPVALNGHAVDEKPFFSEKSQKGLCTVIPSYSYACVNFRNVFQSIVYKLTDDHKLAPLFSTFMDITLKDYTITTYTGYVFQDCKRDSFKFNQFLSSRDEATVLLTKNGLVENTTEWKSFTYTPIEQKYEGNEAIAVLVYTKLIDSLNLTAAFNKYKDTILSEKCSTYIASNLKEDILENLKRK